MVSPPSREPVVVVLPFVTVLILVAMRADSTWCLEDEFAADRDGCEGPRDVASGDPRFGVTDAHLHERDVWGI
jgi:hypothetical protein